MSDIINTIDAIVEKARTQGRPLAIGYVTAGFPDEENFGSTLESLARQCHIVEIAIPFSDPVADSPTAERLELEAVKRGTNLHNVFEALAPFPVETTSRLALAGYYNNFLQYGLDRLAAECKRFSITALLIYDLPFGEYERFRAACPDLRLIPILSAATSDERVQAYAEFPAPYVYIAPAIEASGAEKALDLCAVAQKKFQHLFKVPVGIRYDALALPEAMKQQLSFLWYESSLLEHMEKGESISAFFAPLK